MTTPEKTVKEVSEEIYSFGVQQILIDFVQEEIEELLNDDEDQITRDSIGAASYQCGILLDVYNPKFEKDISILTRLQKALDEWVADWETTNRILGLPPEA